MSSIYVCVFFLSIFGCTPILIGRLRLRATPTPDGSEQLRTTPNQKSAWHMREQFLLQRFRPTKSTHLPVSHPYICMSLVVASVPAHLCTNILHMAKTIHFFVRRDHFITMLLLQILIHQYLHSGPNFSTPPCIPCVRNSYPLLVYKISF